jgi:hypothetical protein
LVTLFPSPSPSTPSLVDLLDLDIVSLAGRVSRRTDDLYQPAIGTQHLAVLPTTQIHDTTV